MRKMMLTITLAIMLGALAAAPAAAAQWCGENGLIRFSFGEGDSLVSVYDSGPAQKGVTTVDLYAWLTDVEPVQYDGEALMSIGGYEFSLTIDGAEAYILSQDFPAEGFNVGRGQGTVAYGLTTGLGIPHGRVQLVHWKIMFQGRPENVRFGLDPAGLTSCAKTEGCPESGCAALYVGSSSTPLLNLVSGAGYVPAWLNPTGKPDTTAVHGKAGWREVGVWQKR